MELNVPEKRPEIEYDSVYKAYNSIKRGTKERIHIKSEEINKLLNILEEELASIL